MHAIAKASGLDEWHYMYVDWVSWLNDFNTYTEIKHVKGIGEIPVKRLMLGYESNVCRRPIVI